MLPPASNAGGMSPAVNILVLRDRLREIGRTSDAESALA